MAYTRSWKKKTVSPEAARRKEQIKTLAETVARMTEEEKQTYISKAGVVLKSDGTMLSLSNMMMAVLQNDRATMVAGYEQWKSLGRQVRAGEQSIKIFAPTLRTRTDDQGEETTSTRFILVSVFDVSQTDEIEAAVNTLSE
jgi:DNA-binding helix-hairpin-helix protein with protein kinase domain